MSTPFNPQSPWHHTHELKGVVLPHRFGPTGHEHCSQCGARRWASNEHYGPTCGGSVEYDSKAAKPCKPNSDLRTYRATRTKETS